MVDLTSIILDLDFILLISLTSPRHSPFRLTANSVPHGFYVIRSARPIFNKCYYFTYIYTISFTF
jgi:hypothetical protein